MRFHPLQHIAALAAVALFVCACHGPAEHVVTMGAMTFDPPSLTIHSGDRVVWRNDDIVPHTVTAQRRFDSGQVPPGGTFKVTVSRDVDYGCTLHPIMRGRIVVQ